jgi:hypothetical protein
MIARRVGRVCLMAIPIGRLAWCLFKRRVAALATISAVGIACMAAPVHAATVTRIEIGSPDTTAFLLGGQLAGGELLALQSEVAKLPPNRRVAVILDSPGGLVSEGLKLGQFFYDAKIATFVFAGGYGCHSACALAFLGGRDAATGKPLRVMMSGARLGFHQFGAKFDNTKTYTKKDMATVVQDTQRVMDAIIGYLRAINEDLDFLALMLRAPHEAITLVNDDEAPMKGIHVMEQKTQRIIDPSNIIQRRVAAR